MAFDTNGWFDNNLLDKIKARGSNGYLYFGYVEWNGYPHSFWAGFETKNSDSLLTVLFERSYPLVL